MACCALAAYLFGAALRGLRKLRGAHPDGTEQFAPAATRPGPVAANG